MTAVPITLAAPASKTDPTISPMRWYEKSKAAVFAARWYYSWTMHNRGLQPVPMDKPQYRAGERAWQLLLVGNGPTHGWGVVSHNLSLTGQVAQALTRRSGNLVNADYVGEELMSAETAVNWLGKRDMSVYDIMVLVLSMNDAVRFMDPETYKQSVEQILARMRENSNPGTKLLVVGIQPVQSVVGYQNWLGALAQRHADRLNAIMRESIEAAGDTFMDLAAPNLEPGRPLGSAVTYATWADAIADNAMPLMPTGEPREATGREEAAWEWNATENLLTYDLENQTNADRLREISERARKKFFGQFAGVSIIQDGVQYHPGAQGLNPGTVPLELSYCQVAIQQDEPLIVTNGWRDERFKDNPYLAQLNLPFYAGMPMKDRSGEVIGSFCVMSAVPRPESLVPIEDLKQYAAEAQAELWRMEDEANAAGK